MKLVKNLMNSVILVGLVLLILTRDAHAYLDPGTGSYIFQLVIAGILGASLAIKIYWGKIKIFFSQLASKKKAEEIGGKNDNK